MNPGRCTIGSVVAHKKKSGELDVEESLLALLAITLLIALVLTPIVALILALVLYRRVDELRARIAWLETTGPRRPETDTSATIVQATLVDAHDWSVGDAAAQAVVARDRPIVEPGQSAAEALVDADSGAVDSAASAARPVLPARFAASINWEQAIGRFGLGWMAVVLLVFGTAFFLRYAYENGWVGPLGRVATGLVAGVLLALAGGRYHRRGWRAFSQMLSAAGVVVLFLSVYSSFGFYHLAPQQVAAAFLLVIVLESALLAVAYNAPTLAWTSLLGGLLIPILMQSDTDRYQSLFTYLTVLDVGVVAIALWRHWAGLAAAALLGTHGLFWLWYAGNYHPEKFAWTVGFQLTIFGLFVLHSLIAHVLRPRVASREDLVRMLLNAALGFGAIYILMRPAYRDWLGMVAIDAAIFYTVLGRIMLARRPADSPQLLTVLAAAVGFIALALPIQARAEWIALGWAVLAAALWCFGLRIRAPTLRAMAAAIGVLAIGRLVLLDTPTRGFELALPVFNRYAAPALGVVVCLFASVTVARRFWSALGGFERTLVGSAGIVGVLLLWFVLSIDVNRYFVELTSEQTTDELAIKTRWLGQVALSAFWAIYALGVLAFGFVRSLPAVRWTALFIFAVTVAKVFLLDMADLKDLYRILAFFILAILLGLAGWTYQQIQTDRQTRES